MCRVEASKWTVAIDCDEATASLRRAVEFKFVLQDAVTLELLAWECLPGNRTLSLSSARNLAR
ncbi:hypothetical protein PINS_up013893 [Pythium insidiosum]|nr:hypothetical protein PINS_up013893 [Pythium insidiosum]